MVIGDNEYGSLISAGESQEELGMLVGMRDLDTCDISIEALCIFSGELMVIWSVLVSWDVLGV